jgi:WD40 repeat protein
LKSKVRQQLIDIEAGWNAITVSHTPGYIFYQKSDGDMTQFDMNTNSEAFVYSGKHSKSIAYVVTTYDDKTMFTFGWDGEAHCWNTVDHTYVFSYPTIGVRYHVACMSHDDKYVVVADYANNVHVYDIENRNEAAVFNPKIGGMAYDMCVTLDNKYLVCVGKGNYGCLFNLETKTIEKNLPGHKGSIPWVAMTPDGKFCLTASYTETIIWNSKTWENIVTIEEDFMLSFSKHRLLGGVLHDGYYKSWSTKVLKDFSDDYQEEEAEQETG